MLIALLAWTLGAAAGPAIAQDSAKPANTAPVVSQPESYPREVKAALQYAHDECRREGGSGVTFAPDTVRKLDLTGDGRDDYIVDLRNVECAGRLSLYCGTAGCNLDILVARRDGALHTVFSDRVREYEILPGAGARTIRFMMHGSYCGRSGNPSCPKERQITGKRFEFTEPR